MAIKQRTKSLKSQSNDLSDSFVQLKVLNNQKEHGGDFEKIESKLKKIGYLPLKATGVDIFQINMGKMCNQTCAHCHVDAGPDRKEIMTKETLQKCLNVIGEHKIKTVDLTGGAPEMNPNFRWFVEEVSKLGCEIINRCNLTIVRANKKYHDLPQFFAKHKIKVVSSLPHYNKKRTDNQRGDGVYEDSILALKMLNEVGYGVEGSGLTLDLVYNPSGHFLPSDQMELENEFKSQLKRKHEITFNNLLAITNLPISRFLDYLVENGHYETYMEKLIEAYNPSTVPNLMCRNTISVGWDGFLYDCDFNQMLDLNIGKEVYQHLDNFDIDYLTNRSVITNQHCYGCTAGAGSSCGGEIVN